MEGVQRWSYTQRQAAQAPAGEEDMDLKRGPWTVDEDLILVDYIAKHGEGRWNSLARCAGLKRTGKSCRLRWLNYLRPDVRRGNITPQEQLLILELHSRWGNRWSKIAQYLPGRTDNEIKNYWRTRVQKHAKQLKCDVDSKKFKDAMRYLWMPRLVERIRAAASCTMRSSSGAAAASAAPSSSPASSCIINASMQAADGHGKVLTIPGSPLESSDVDDPSVISDLVGSSTGTRMPSPSSDSDCYVVDCYPAGAQALRGDHAASAGFTTFDDMQDDNVWVKSSLLSTVPQSLDDQSASMDHLQQQLDYDECGGDIFVDKFWSFEDIWSMEEDIF